MNNFKMSPRNLRIATTSAMASAALMAAMMPSDPALAEDIDLFLANSGEQYAPNVYVMVDNSANWNANISGTSKREMEYEALRSVFLDSELAEDSDDSVNLRLGFGLFSSGRGGKVWQAVEGVTEGYQTDTLAPLFEHINASNDPLKTNNAPYAMSFNEAIAYFAGNNPVAGTEDDKRTDENPEGYDPAAIDEDGSYNSPAAGNCGKNYVILMGNGSPDSGEDNTAEEELGEHGGLLSGDPISIDPNMYESNWSDEYARFMAGKDIVSRDGHEESVRTYVIDVFDPDDNNRPAQSARAWMKSIATRGDGLYFAAHDESDIKEALDTILDELFAVNDVFAASTLPVSVNVRGTNLNQVYMGVFRPDEMNRTRWQGNLKLYQLAVDDETNTLHLADKDGEPAQSPATGFIRETAWSFWSAHSDYWEFAYPDDPSDAPDGEFVEKGGAHQQLRLDYPNAPSSGRTIFTDSGGSLNDFKDVADADSLNVSDPNDLIDWIYGENNVDSENSNDPDTESNAGIRPSVHGDVLHSQPAVVNYGSGDDGEGDIYAFYGANDGMLHALRGGKEDGDGEEVWGFIPAEFHDRLDRLRTLEEGKEYFVDGAISVYRHDDNGDGEIVASDGDEVRLYVAMRRGGRLLYALDVTDPENPAYLWKIDEDTTGFSELGQTWSRPEVVEVAYDEGSETVERDVLVFGGGYDPAADADVGSYDADGIGDAGMGRALFALDAETGDLIWQAANGPTGGSSSVDVPDMKYPIPSDVSVIDRDGDGYDDRLYVGDLGGQVWRADISGHPDDWSVYKLASDGDGAGTADRRFLYPPDVVYGEDGNGRYDAVLLGSGARTHPFRRSVINRFYMFKDRHTGTTVDDVSTWETIEAGDLLDVTGDEDSIDESLLEDRKGWYIDLLNAAGEGAGEKVVSSAVTLSGSTFFSTNEPPPEETADDECNQSLGTARNYEINYQDGTVANEENEGRSSKAVGGGFPPSPVPVIVEIDGQKYEAVISGTEAHSPPGTTMGRRNPVYWNRQIDD
ncbi:MAG: PilC/PilY family type IV pilus protein [Halofilum sp. (in: g-proteobacteria)]